MLMYTSGPMPGWIALARCRSLREKVAEPSRHGCGRDSQQWYQQFDSLRNEIRSYKANLIEQT